MNPDDPKDLLFVEQMPFCVDYADGYHLTLTSFGPTPNRVRQYLRQRFVYSLAEVMAVKVPLPLLCSWFEDSDAKMVGQELERLGAEVQVVCKHGGPEDESQHYPEVRVGLVYPILHL
jgi:hypothetical protein